MTVVDPRSLDRVARPERVAYVMRALGKAGLPGALLIGDARYQLVRSVKHDFFAATGFYDDDAGRRVVLKISRTQDFAGVPLAWIGKWLCRRETQFYSRLHDLPNIPKLLGVVGETGFVHAYVPGKPLSYERPVPEGFFDQLQDLLVEMHRRQIAYVDTNKPENILLGSDGRPHLIDFQISFDRAQCRDWWLTRALLRRMHAGDLYHIVKHKKRLRPDELTAADRRRLEDRTPLIRLHRFVFKPYFRFRRSTFERLRATGRLLPEGSK